MLEVLKKRVEDNISDFKRLVDTINLIRDQIELRNPSLKDNNLFFEVLYWGLAVDLRKNQKKFEKTLDFYFIMVYNIYIR